MDLKGTKTEKNLMEAFAGESQARNKYTYYASQAKTAMFKSLRFLKKPLRTNKNTPSFGLSSCTVVQSPQQK